ncbi:heterogeneous nuclear ribonucleoproteins A1 homolog [Lampris incognitus]|uniref:heterogeneous nuclear ribonucleoproteins A1 homolog n=1 Tax=Lampris incognitus TaxID=2546036 RepID=UPI0024B55F85|nr:heterogeneous nuclear ribonucleoproteins A1 homolog [Lampris incognitus]
MDSGKGEPQSGRKKRVYISLPKKHMANLAEHYELEHGLVIRQLNPYINEGYLQAYFREWGTVTGCRIYKSHSPENSKGLAFVRFSTGDEADMADWAGPHYIGGTEVDTRRVVSPKMEEDSDMDIATVTAVSGPKRRRSMGLGYILEDAQWLDDELEE